MAIWLLALLLPITCVLSTQMGHVSSFKISEFQDLSNVIRTFQSNGFWPCNHTLKIWKSIGTPSQSGSSLGSVGVHSLTLSHTLESMKCDSRASLWPSTSQTLALVMNPRLKLWQMNSYAWKCFCVCIVYNITCVYASCI